MKTDVLTKCQPKVASFYLGIVKQKVWGPEISITLARLVQQCILVNTSCQIEINDDHRYEPVGDSPIEIAMHNWLVDNGV